ncbi:MAG: methyltransferase domain-containing protein, partial [Acidobacteriota bacterium]
MKPVLLACLATAACASRPARPIAEPAAPVVIAPAAPPAPAPLADATVIERSHDWFDAIDRADVDAFAAPLAPKFVAFEDERSWTADATRKWLQGRNDRHDPVHSRTWSDEHVYAEPSSAVFIGKAVEHIPEHGDRPASDEPGYNTLVWAREGDRWQVVYWGWQVSGIEAERQRWNERFRGGLGFKKQPNQLLVDTVKGKKPGTALDLLMGQGRNALYLASQGWKVTGVDISDEGLRMTRDEAARQKVKLDLVQSDIDKYDLGTDRWDLVTMIYAGDDAKLLERIKPAVKKGGLFVTEYFASD